MDVGGTLYGSGTHAVNLTNFGSLSLGLVSGFRGGIDNINYSTSSVSEPSVLALMGFGLIGLSLARRRKGQA